MFRLVVIVPLLAAGGFLVFWGGFVALKVFADAASKDNDDATYLIIGALLATLGTMLLVTGLLLILAWVSDRRTSRRRSPL